MQHLKVRGNTWLATNQIKILCMQGNISTTFMFSFHGNILIAKLISIIMILKFGEIKLTEKFLNEQYARYGLIPNLYKFFSSDSRLPSNRDTAEIKVYIYCLKCNEV